MSDKILEVTETVSVSCESAGEDSFRSNFVADFPRLLSKALQEYRRFSASPVGDDAKSFAVYQAGCRAALAHVHLLVKLVDWACSSESNGMLPADGGELMRLLDEADAAVAREDFEQD